MKIGILHFSDLHLTEEYSICNEREDLIISSLNQKQLLDVDKIFFVLSGDLTYQGKDKEYKQVTKLINSIKKKVERTNQNLDFEVLVVPGNHDIDFGRNHADDFAKFNDGSYISIQEKKKELKKLDSFYSFSKKYNLFDNDAKMVDFVTYEKENIRINFCLINSAIYSLRDSQSDKGYHHLFDNELDDIESSSNGNINIMIMHHDFSWFDWNTRTRIESICNKYYSILLFGHDHYVKIEKIKHNDNLDTLYIQGDESIKNGKIESFSYYLINTELREVNVNCFNYNVQGNLFISLNDINKMSFKTKVNRVIQLNEDFEREISLSDKNNKNIFDYFVFPKLSYLVKDDADEKEYYINNYQELKKIVEGKRIINITGTDCVGKTTLLNFLYSISLSKMWF